MEVQAVSGGKLCSARGEQTPGDNLITLPAASLSSLSSSFSQGSFSVLTTCKSHFWGKFLLVTLLQAMPTALGFPVEQTELTLPWPGWVFSQREGIADLGCCHPHWHDPALPKHGSGFDAKVSVPPLPLPISALLWKPASQELHAEGRAGLFPLLPSHSPPLTHL